MAGYNYTNQSPVSVLLDENSMDGLIDVYQQGESGLEHLPAHKKELLLGLISFIVESGCERIDDLEIESKPTMFTVVPAVSCRTLFKNPKKCANDSGY